MEKFSLAVSCFRCFSRRVRRRNALSPGGRAWASITETCRKRERNDACPPEGALGIQARAGSLPGQVRISGILGSPQPVNRQATKRFRKPERRAAILQAVLGTLAKSLIHKSSELHTDRKADGNEGGNQRGQAGAHQWQRNSYNRQDSEFHPDVDEYLKR